MSNSTLITVPLPHEAAEMYRLMAEEIKDCAICLMDTKGLITVWNTAAECMKGYSAQEAVGQYLGMLYTDQQQAKGWPAHNLKCAQEDGFYQEETWRKRKDGSLFWAHVALTALRDESGVLLGFSKITLDLSEHKRLEQCLKEKDETRRILQVANAGTWKWNVATNQVELSPHLLCLLGYPEHEEVKTYADWMRLICPDDRQEVSEKLQNVLNHSPDRQLAMDMRMCRKDGGYRWFYVGADWCRDGDNARFVLMGVSVDIHEMKMLAEERERLFLQLQAERIRFAEVLEQMPSGVFLADVPSGKLVYGNQEGKEMLGRPSFDTADYRDYVRYSVTRPDGRSLRPEEHPLARAVLHGEVTRGEQVIFNRSDGSHIHLSVTAAPIMDSDNKTRLAVAVLHDIEALTQVQKSLELEKKRAHVTLTAITDGVITTDLHGMVEEINPAAERLTGWTQNDARGRPIDDVFHIVEEINYCDIPDPITRCLTEDRVIVTGAHAVLIGRDGQRYSIEHSAAPLRIADRLDGAVLVIHDVTESRGLLYNLGHQASHDALTGLLNRREFSVRLQRTLDRCRLMPGRGAVLLYMDLDQFKIVNDTCGHSAGDDLLRQLAVEYQAHVRERDTLARIGGDEFALIIEHCTVQEGILVAQKVLETTRNFRYVCKNQAFQLGVSIGLIPIDGNVDTIEESLRLADHACYIAKESGRSRIFVQHTNDIDMERRRSDMQWVTRLGDACRADWLQLFFQPIYPLGKEERGLHYEILLRMKNGKEVPIEPGHFLPAAERYDVMPSVDRWVLTKSLEWLEDNPKHVAKLELCTINLSQRTLADESFQKFASALLKSTSVPAQKLCFEITETGAIANMHNTLTFINKLKEQGCRFALDDFGTGMASFAYLKQIPVDFVKIDGSFIQLMTRSKVDCEMVRFANEISHVMGRQTIAEYVGDEITLKNLEEMGVDFAQGFLLGRPRPLTA